MPQHIINIIAEENGEGGIISSIGRGGGDEIPHLVSIGPNHFGNPKFSEMETHKAKILDLESRRWSSGTGASLTNALLEMEGRARKWEARRPLDIEFSSWLGVLRITTFCIDDTNVSVLKNLLAYEQGSREVRPYFSCLTVFFSNIAATPGDVEFLRETGIIQHQPGNDHNVVVLLQELYKLVKYSFHDDCLIECQVQDINRFVTNVTFLGRLSVT
nr:UPF0481 protein At3g47200-like [Ipomoea batatas]